MRKKMIYAFLAFFPLFKLKVGLEANERRSKNKPMAISLIKDNY